MRTSALIRSSVFPRFQLATEWARQLSIPSTRTRFTLYAIILAVVGSWVCFRHLAGGMLNCDEASFAYTTDRMVSTGDWIVPYINARVPHLNATPLYNWLCSLTAPLFGESNLKYRAWSAAFGVGCGLMVLVLGTLLFSAEVGLVAGLFLLTSLNFVFMHGARWGVMESTLAFFVTAMVVCYVRTFQIPERASRWWALLGICFGLAILTKPPVLGGFFFCMLSLHHLVTRRELPWKRRFAGPFVAGLVAAVVALPWYAAITSRVGPGAVRSLIVYNSVGRAQSTLSQAPPHPPTMYLTGIWRNSLAFRVAIAATGFALVCVLLGWRRREWGILLTAIVPYFFAISIAATKNIHYAYYVYPFLALAGAAMLLAALSKSGLSESTGRKWLWNGAAAVGVVAAFLLVRHEYGIIKIALKFQQFDYPPLHVYRGAEEELAAGRMRLVLFRYPTSDLPANRNLLFTAHDLYYLSRMPHATIVRKVAELKGLIADGKPTIVFLLPLDPLWGTIPELHLQPETTAILPSATYSYPVLTFNGATGKLAPGLLPHAN